MRREPPLTSMVNMNTPTSSSLTAEVDKFSEYSHYDIILYAEAEDFVLPLFSSLKTNLVEERVSIKSRIGKSQIGDLIPISLSKSSYIFKVIKKKT